MRQTEIKRKTQETDIELAGSIPTCFEDLR